MMLKIKDYKIEIVQQVDRINVEDIVTYALSLNPKIKYAWFVHNKDNSENIHFHLLLWCDRKSYLPLTSILNNFDNLEEQHFQKVKKLSSAIRYLLHLDQPDKYAYYKDVDYTAIHTNDILDYYFVEESAKKCLDKYAVDFTYSYSQCFKDIGAKGYAKYKGQFDKISEWRSSQIKTRNIKVLYFVGTTGSGKTEYSKYICKLNNYSYYFTSSGKNMFDDYKGQDCVILDDFRDSQMSFNDLLKLTDNYNLSPVACRYYNKTLSDVKLIIITCPMKPNELYKNMTDVTDRIDQLFRRLDYKYYNLSDDYPFEDFVTSYSTNGDYLGIVRPKSDFLKFTAKDDLNIII